MQWVLAGQILLCVCFVFYLIWWWRGFRPGVTVNRVGGMNLVLLLITALCGLAGIVFSLMPVAEVVTPKIDPLAIVVAGLISYVVLFFVTQLVFNRVVTTELFLIVGWTMLEIVVINKLNAAGILTDASFIILCVMFAVAFIVSIILYVAYYKMEEMKAFYTAMVPLIIGVVAGAILVIMMIL